MKKIMLITITMLIVITLVAEENFTKSLGFAGGLISGSGFSYRQISEHNGFQITLGAISHGDNEYGHNESAPGNYYGYDDDYPDFTEKSYGRNSYANIGINYIKPLHKSDKSMFYALAGSALYYSSEDYSEQLYIYDEDDDLYYATGEAIEETDTNYTINAGIGIGMEYRLTENIRISLDWPIVFSSYDESYDIIMTVPQGGIHYYFK